MNLNDMRSIVRRDLHDEDGANYRWSDDEINRAIDRAVKEFSLAAPLEDTALLATSSGSREVNIAGLEDRITIEKIEYPVDRDPRQYCEFSLREDTVELKDMTGDGSDCRVYYGRLHTLDSAGSTIPECFKDLVVSGAAGYALLELSVFTLNRVNAGGITTASDLFALGKDRLERFQKELARIRWRNGVKSTSLITY